MNVIQLVSGPWRIALGTRERREREKRERRAGILAVARNLFWENGFRGTTMPEIAAAAELAPGTLYLYFPSKDALYAELLVEGYQILTEALQAAAARKGTPRRRAETLIEAFMGFAREHPQYFDIIFFVLQREATRRSVLGEDQLRRLEACEKACKQVAAGVLKETGRRSAKELALTVEAVWSMLVGVVFFWRHDEEKVFAAVARQAKRLVLEAILGE